MQTIKYNIQACVARISIDGPGSSRTICTPQITGN